MTGKLAHYQFMGIISVNVTPEKECSPDTLPVLQNHIFGTEFGSRKISKNVKK
jgi:hypothetical protein